MDVQKLQAKKIYFRLVKKNKKKINIFDDPKKAVKNADVIFSDKVISLNDKVNIKKKTKILKKFFIDDKLLKLAPKSIFLHCLPRGNEVSEKVFLGKNLMYGNKLKSSSCSKKYFNVLF